MSTSSKVYNSKRWKSKSKVIRKRDDYLCRECKRYGKTTSADLVHHIFPSSSNPEYFWENDNLISLCNSCHEKMHDRQTGELSHLGERWKNKVRHKLNNPRP